MTRHQKAEAYARRFDAILPPTCIAVLAAAAGILATDMIATGAESASTARALGSDAAAHMEARP